MNEPGMPTMIFFFIVLPTAVFVSTVANRFAHSIFDYFQGRNDKDGN